MFPRECNRVVQGLQKDAIILGHTREKIELGKW